MAAVASSASWAPSSPRLSFSRDFVQSEVFTPSPSSSRVYGDSGDASSQDFDFGMLALLRKGDLDAATPMLPADELFSNGRLIVKGLSEKSPAATVGMASSSSTTTTTQQQQQQQQLESPRRRDPPHASQSSSRSATATSGNRWREFFGRHKASSSASMSEIEPLTAASSSPAMASSSSFSSPPSLCSSSSSSVSSSAIKCTKLKLLFRSSSAGGSMSRRHPAEPCLGRSASESKASCCSCCTAQTPQPNAPIVVSPQASSASSRVHPSHKQQPTTVARRRTPSETSYQKLGQQPSAARRPLGNKKADAWKAYMNMNSANERGVGSSASSSLTSSTSSSAAAGGAKVAQVLHMDVCIGQSMVVSKVAKVFVRKDSNNNNNNRSL